jgi:hypothetical protein
MVLSLEVFRLRFYVNFLSPLRILLHAPPRKPHPPETIHGRFDFICIPPFTTTTSSMQCNQHYKYIVVKQTIGYNGLSTERRRRFVSSTASYLGYSGLTSRREDELSWSSSVPYATIETSGYYLELLHDHFFVHSISLFTCYHSMLHNLKYWRRRWKKYAEVNK